MDSFRYERCGECELDLDDHLIGADSHGHAHLWCRVAGTPPPAGLAAQFNPDELDCLIRTAAELTAGGSAPTLGDLSERQLALGRRAWALMEAGAG